VDETRQNTENTSNDPNIKDNNGDDEDGGGMMNGNIHGGD